MATGSEHTAGKAGLRGRRLGSPRRRRGATGLRRILPAVVAFVLAVGAVGLLGNSAAAGTEPADAGPADDARLGPADARPVESTSVLAHMSCAGTAAVGRSTTAAGLIRDCETLLAAKDHLDVRGARLNWHPEVPMRLWAGIGLDGYPGRVNKVDLRFHGLDGSIPSGLANLTKLTQLKLSNNYLTGPIPPELGNLTKLRQLFLENNQLTGSIPPELGNLTRLTHLQLDRNELTGLLPPELGLIRTLRSLRVAHNQLSGCIPSSLHESPGFDIEPPPAIGLPLCAPQVCKSTLAVPESPGDVRLVMDCDALLDAKPTLDPDDVLNWRTGTAIGDWDGVTIVESTYGPRVGAVNLPFRFLTGTIPPTLRYLSELGSLDLSQNLLSGSIPDELGDLVELRTLDLNGNLLGGEIPAGVGKLTGLTRLALQNNSLTGPLPPELGNLAELTSLRLEDNLLTGPIPRELGNLALLTRLDLGDNRLTGTIPRDVVEFTALRMLGLDGNRLTGDIPPELAELTALRILFLWGNGFTGCVPGTLLRIAQNDIDTLALPVCEDQ